MRVEKLERMTKGWFVGNFEPTVRASAEVEVAVKHYTAGTVEARHHHKIAVEITTIVTGRARMNEIIVGAGDIVTIEPGESTDFEALSDTTTVVVKLPCVSGDKYLDP